MVTPEIRDTPLIPVPQAMDTQAAQGILLIPALQATDTQATRDTPLIGLGSRPNGRHGRVPQIMMNFGRTEVR